MEWISLIARWAHILSAITALGGSIFIRFVLMQAADSSLSEGEHAQMRPEIMGRWRRIVHVCIALFLLSGIWNLVVNSIPQHEGQALYHALFGIKFILALTVFFLAVALTSAPSKFVAIKRRRTVYLTLLIALGVGVVMISGYLRTIPIAS